MLASLSTRRYPVGLEPVSSALEATATGTSKSAVSRRFVAKTKIALEELMGRPLADLRPLVLMIDGLQVADHLCVVALVIDADGRKIPVGLVEGATENANVVTRLLDGLVYGRDPLGGTGHLHHQVGPIDRRPQPFGLVDRGGGVVGQLGGNLHAHVPVVAATLVGDGPEDVSRGADSPPAYAAVPPRSAPVSTAWPTS